MSSFRWSIVGIAVSACLIASSCTSDESSAPDGPRRTTTPAATDPGLVARTTTPYAPPPSADPVGPGAPAVGTCLALSDADVEPGTEYVRDLELGLGPTADCADPHTAQVLAVVEVPRDATVSKGGDPITGDDLLRPNNVTARVVEAGEEACWPTYDALSASVLALDDVRQRAWSLEERVRLPSTEQWDEGARWAACVVRAPDEVPILGVADVTAISATDPLPASLLSCTGQDGDAASCDDDGVAGQRFLLIPARNSGGRASGGATAAIERCTEELERVAPSVAADDSLLVGGTAGPVQRQSGAPRRSALQCSTLAGGGGEPLPIVR